MSIADLVPQNTAARSTRGRVPVGRVLLRGELLDVTATSASLSFSESEHDQAKLGFTSPTLTTTDGLVDQPISFVWGVAPHSEYFSGYVTQVSETSGGASGALTFSLTVLGATKAMYEGRPRFWSQKSATSAIADLVNRNALGSYGHDSTYLWSGLAQTDESDWEVANSFAKRVGFRLFNRYGVILCYDPMRLFKESGIYARLVMGANFDPTTDRSLLEFEPQEQAAMLQENMGVKYGYFTSGGSVQVATQVGNFKGYTFATNIVVDNQDAATVYTNAATRSMDRWQQYAMARVWGDADLYPGLCVEIVSTNARYMRNKYDGKWLIRATSHSLDRQQFQTMLLLVRPDNTTPVAVTPYVPFWKEGAGRAQPTLSLSSSAKEDPAYWISSWANSRLRSIA